MKKTFIENTYTNETYIGYRTGENRLVFGIEDAAAIIEAAGYQTTIQYEKNMLCFSENNQYRCICAELFDVVGRLCHMFDVNRYIISLLESGHLKFAV